MLLDILVKPELPVRDYLTPYSGITARMLQTATHSFTEARRAVLAVLAAVGARTPGGGAGAAGALLVGHSLESDLKALRLVHRACIDTSVLFPHHRGGVYKNSLRWLAKKYLNATIQAGGGTPQGHDSVEDASAAMLLALLKLDGGSAFGMPSPPSKLSVFAAMSRANVRTAMVARPEVLKKFASRVGLTTDAVAARGALGDVARSVVRVASATRGLAPRFVLALAPTRHVVPRRGAAPPAGSDLPARHRLVGCTVNELEDAGTAMLAALPPGALVVVVAARKVSVLLCTVTCYANLAHNLTRSP